jgi:hypothetical protein
VLDHEQTVEQLEGYRRNGKEVERHDRFAVIVEEGQPTLVGITTAPDASQIPRHTTFANDEAQFLEFAVNLRSTPDWDSLRPDGE